jgi:hypothetical protein
LDGTPSRLQAAQAILDLLPPAPAVSVVGGDLNALSGVGEQDPPGANPAITLLLGGLTDVYAALGVPQQSCSSPNRIDYIMFRGPYLPTGYDSCQDSAPSDHPFVLATFTAG